MNRAVYSLDDGSLVITVETNKVLPESIPFGAHIVPMKAAQKFVRGRDPVEWLDNARRAQCRGGFAMNTPQWWQRLAAWLKRALVAPEPMRDCTRFELQSFVANHPEFAKSKSWPHSQRCVVTFALGNTLHAQYQIEDGKECCWQMRKEAA